MTWLTEGVGALPLAATAGNRRLAAGKLTVRDDQTRGAGVMLPTTVPFRRTVCVAGTALSWYAINWMVAVDASAPDATAAASVGCARAGVDEGTGLREPNARVTGTAAGMGMPVALQAFCDAAAGKSRSLGGGGRGGKVSGRKTASAREHDHGSDARHAATVAEDGEARVALSGCTRAEHRGQEAGLALADVRASADAGDVEVHGVGPGEGGARHVETPRPRRRQVADLDRAPDDDMPTATLPKTSGEVTAITGPPPIPESGTATVPSGSSLAMRRSVWNGPGAVGRNCTSIVQLRGFRPELAAASRPQPWTTLKWTGSSTVTDVMERCAVPMLSIVTGSARSRRGAPSRRRRGTRA